MTNPTPPAGQMELHDNFEPGIQDGTYAVSLTQTVAADGVTITDAPAQTIRVAGPRFSLDPADVHIQFPPPGSTGAFAEVLPHIAFTKRLLPWERISPPFGPDVPWLAVLVFAEGELDGDRGSGDFAQTIGVPALLTSGDVRGPTVVPTPDELTQSCRAITFAGALFPQIVPAAAELPLLAHVRRVAAGAAAVLDTKDLGEFSVVVANRFPPAGAGTRAAPAVAHLVSLEGFGDLLPVGGPPGTPAQPQVRMASLASWTFSALPEPAQSFAVLATNLSTDATGAQRPADSLRLRLPGVPAPTAGATGFAAQAEQRLYEGCVALGYHAATGDDGFAWYSGPLTPVVRPPVPKAGPFQSSAAAMQFDAQTGLFDHSLATAWQAGRSLALADEAFATALMRIRVAANAVLEAEVASGDAVHAGLAAVLGGVVHAIGGASNGAGVDPAAAPVELAAPPAPAIAAVRDALTATDVPVDPKDPDVVTVTQWLARLQLLYPVPFLHLVPDARMLPPETIRFFYVDPAWIGALVDGAMSVGIGTTRDGTVQLGLTTQLEQLASAAALAYRASTLGQPAPATAIEPAGGIIVRSTLVAGWPGTTVTARAGGTELALLRMDHLAPTVLLCLFNGVPDTVTLTAPHEGLEFGVEDGGELVLRSLSAPLGQQIGEIPVVGPDAPATTTRPGGRGVLNLDAGGNDLLDAIAHGLQLDRSSLGPADFALQMLKMPEQVSFPPVPPTGSAA